MTNQLTGVQPLTCWTSVFDSFALLTLCLALPFPAKFNYPQPSPKLHDPAKVFQICKFQSQPTPVNFPIEIYRPSQLCKPGSTFADSQEIDCQLSFSTRPWTSRYWPSVR
uniref:Uncharacterized protein n=1 Tax=Opuntia streptacantha TaxID=393608 RepID=A0A7C9CH46_OPUST